ncbi:hypothetical protein Syn7502_00710 [Synechococcus sp. PCC 7502]|uniref:hypothetical protein n=1 Tax=Synechococcus sp. PCC 7502 TaxID=1173263 RepID=UPI00029FB9B3|nr:hypothetical protein [Synechococcus sp. PCC 7502]AFY72852.1 hypothetical protein Syn7502_00710 [Synechococcus sp. PCC 7502]
MQAIAKFFGQILKLLQQSWAELGQAPRRLWVSVVAIALVVSLGACSSNSSEITPPPKHNLNAIKPAPTKITITEVSPPLGIQKLSRYFDAYEPQVKIVEPKSDQVLMDTKVAIKFDVKDLPIFKNPDLGLGTHIHVILDNQEYKASYDLNQPVVFENLTAGTHTIRAFASRPWHESFKNEGAFAQTTFHVYTKTSENTPNPQLPLLTYSRPVGNYGAEPIMLDFYLKNTPLHAALLDEDPAKDWQIRVTVNNQSFNIDQWLPIYIKGLNPGLNWVKLEFLDAAGHVVPNQFNSTAHLINYQPGGTDTLSRLVRGETIEGIEAIADPNYFPNDSKKAKEPEAKELKSEPTVPKPTQEPTQVVAPKIEPLELSTPKPETPIAKETPVKLPEIPKTIPTPKVVIPEVISTPVTPITKLKISEPTDTEDFQPVEQIAKPTVTEVKPVTPVIIAPKSPEPEPAVELSSPATSEPAVKPIESESLPKPSKGLDSLNLGERLKQARQKKVTITDPQTKPEADLKVNLKEEVKADVEIDPQINTKTEPKLD